MPDSRFAFSVTIAKCCIAVFVLTFTECTCIEPGYHAATVSYGSPSFISDTELLCTKYTDWSEYSGYWAPNSYSVESFHEIIVIDPDSNDEKVVMTIRERLIEWLWALPQGNRYCLKMKDESFYRQYDLDGNQLRIIDAEHVYAWSPDGAYYIARADTGGAFSVLGADNDFRYDFIGRNPSWGYGNSIAYNSSEYDAIYILNPFTDSLTTLPLSFRVRGWTEDGAYLFGHNDDRWVYKIDIAAQTALSLNVQTPWQIVTSSDGSVLAWEDDGITVFSDGVLRDLRFDHRNRSDIRY